MNIGFWNIAGNSNNRLKDLIYSFANDENLDILVLLECEIDTTELILALNSHENKYYYLPSIIPNSYFKVFSKRNADIIKTSKEEKRVRALSIIDPISYDINLILIHYQSKIFWDDSNQDAHSCEIKNFIDDVEKINNHDRTIVMGDFNMNPFQYGMTQSTGLHAIMDKHLARNSSRIIDGKQYKFFYNPMWSFFGEEGKGDVNGTFYYSSAKPICYFWNILDQVIIRPSLLDTFDDKKLKIHSSINGIDLINENNKINTEISDHLPISFNINLKF